LEKTVAKDAGGCICGGGCPTKSRKQRGWRRSFNPATPATGQGRGRLGDLCQFNVTVIIKLEAFL
jgi:hypothetical protein